MTHKPALPGKAVSGLLVPAVLAALAVMLALAASCAPAAEAAGQAPGWELSASHYPTNLPPGSTATIGINVFNVGAAPSSGPVTVTDVLPPGVTATDAGDLIQVRNGSSPFLEHEDWDCSGNGPGEAPGILEATIVSCTNDPVNVPFIEGGGAGPNSSGPFHEQAIGIAVAVSAGAAESTVTNHVTVAGGGAPGPASTSDAVAISSSAPGFGFTGWDGWFSNADGTLDTQAGSHPYEATFVFHLSTQRGKAQIEPTGGQVRNIAVDLPPGFVGNPDAVPQCTRQQLNGLRCPNASQIGILTAYIGGLGPLHEQVFNMVPPPGVAAEFAASASNINTFLDAEVRSGSDYGITTHANSIPQRNIASAVITVWGTPGDASHDPWRTGIEGGCTKEEIEKNIGNSCGALGETPGFRQPAPFLTLPTACGAPQDFAIHANTWQNASLSAEANFTAHDAGGNPTGFTGCELLGFGPTLTAAPDTARADTPTGLSVEVKPTVGGLTDQNGLSTADIKDTTVALPPGLVINPGQAAGLQACDPGEDGLTTPREEAEGKEDNGPPSCPNASKVGTVKAKTPLLEGAVEKELEGSVYVMRSNPPHLKLLAAFSGDGVNVKLVLNVELDERTGQVVTRVVNVPEFPVSEFKLSFSGGAQAALDTPAQCGTYTTTSDFTPWSSPFVADLFPSSPFSLTEGPGGGSCPPSPLPFAPQMTAGSSTDQAGGFTDFSLLLQRGDGQQRIERLQFKEPPGLAGLISAVPLCPEPQAAMGQCGEVSKIGHTVVTSGPGPYPLVVPQPGEPEAKIYLTGPYDGHGSCMTGTPGCAPYGLSIVTPVIAGPFDLGTIITRAKIEVDPTTAQITVTTDPLPQIVDGVPTDLRSINAIIDRQGFLFNPTNCDSQQFTGTATSTGGAATAQISSAFGVGSCRSLGFTPKVAVSTAAKSSKANGASLAFKISYPSGALGTQSWFKEAKFDFPKQLPARLTTIQKACLASVFEANPAACPSASLIGHATVHTQVLPGPLTGPVYFVSHGGEKFPDAVIVLQGDGVTIDLRGETFINGKTGITSATFANTPDVPFESIEVSVPSGPFSEFAANLPAKAKGSFCGQKLLMPTKFVAQNGLRIERNTQISVAGCGKAKRTRAQKLAAALKACKRKARGRRAACVRAARRRFGAVKRRGAGKR